MRSVTEVAGGLRRAVAYGAVGLAATMGTVTAASPAQAAAGCPWQHVCWYGGPYWDYPFKAVSGRQAYCTNMPKGWNDTIWGVRNNTSATRFRYFQHENCYGRWWTIFARTSDHEVPDAGMASSYAMVG